MLSTLCAPQNLSTHGRGRVTWTVLSGNFVLLCGVKGRSRRGDEHAALRSEGVGVVRGRSPLAPVSSCLCRPSCLVMLLGRAYSSQRVSNKNINRNERSKSVRCMLACPDTVGMLVHTQVHRGTCRTSDLQRQLLSFSASVLSPAVDGSTVTSAVTKPTHFRSVRLKV